MANPTPRPDPPCYAAAMRALPGSGQATPSPFASCITFTCVAVACVVGALSLNGCGKANRPATPFVYRAQTSPANTLLNFVDAYRRRDTAEYAKLLADDFTFRFDPRAWDHPGSGVWNRAEDVAGTGRIFAAPAVGHLWLQMDQVTDGPVNEVGRESWRLMRIPDTFLQVTLALEAGEDSLTLTVDGDVQEFYFRRGRSPADTLVTSPTAGLYHLVEWRELGRPGRPERGVAAADAPTSVEIVNWGAIKYGFSSGTYGHPTPPPAAPGR